MCDYSAHPLRQKNVGLASLRNYSSRYRDLVVGSGMEHGAAECYDRLAEFLLQPEPRSRGVEHETVCNGRTNASHAAVRPGMFLRSVTPKSSLAQRRRVLTQLCRDAVIRSGPTNRKRKCRFGRASSRCVHFRPLGELQVIISRVADDR